MIKLTVKNRDKGTKQEYKLTQNAVLIGRQPNCDVILESAAVSRRHAKITVQKNLVEIEDLGSGNGTIVNKNLIRAREKISVKNGDIIRIEEFEIEFEQGAPPADTPEKDAMAGRFEETTDPDIIEIKMIKKVLSAMDQDKLPCLVVLSEPFQDKKVYFENSMDELVIGREPTCHLQLDTDAISRRHAVISIKWGGLVIIDLDSKNGTFVNGQKIKERSIRNNDEIVFGTVKAVFKNPQEFNIEELSRDISEQKKKRFEDTDSLEKGLFEEKEVTKPSRKKGKKLSEKEENELNQLAAKETPKPVQKPAPQAQKPLNSRFTPGEIILLGFGTLVILIVLVVMVRLLF